MSNLEVFNSGNSAAAISLAAGGTLYYVGRIDGVSGKVHKLRSLDLWCDNAANTDGTYEVVIARCTTTNVDTEWGAITGLKTDSSAGAAVAGVAYIPSGGTPAPTGVSRMYNYGGISYGSKFSRLFSLNINPAESLLIAVQHPVNSRNVRFTFELETP